VGVAYTKYNTKRADLILDVLREGGSMTQAAQRAGICFKTAYNWVRDHPDFAAEVEQAREQGTDRLEDRLTELAYEGNVVALLASLKARRPKKWREQQAVEHTGPEGTPLTIVIAERQDGPQ
jgi:transposase-like protein